MKFGDIGELAVLTLRNPDAAMRVLRGLDLPMVARWMALFLAVVLSRMLGVLLLMMLPVHGICMLLCARDARYFDLLLMWAKTRLLAYLSSIRFWKGASYSPLLLDLPDRHGRRKAIATVRLS